jgi:hypothetical protein
VQGPEPVVIEVQRVDDADGPLSEGVGELLRER